MWNIGLNRKDIRICSCVLILKGKLDEINLFKKNKTKRNISAIWPCTLLKLHQVEEMDMDLIQGVESCILPQRLYLACCLRLDLLKGLWILLFQGKNKVNQLWHILPKYIQLLQGIWSHIPQEALLLIYSLGNFWQSLLQVFQKAFLIQNHCKEHLAHKKL